MYILKSCRLCSRMGGRARCAEDLPAWKSVAGIYFAISRQPRNSAKNEREKSENKKSLKNQTQSQHFTTLNHSSTSSTSLASAHEIPFDLKCTTKILLLKRKCAIPKYWMALCRKWQNGCKQLTEWMVHERRRCTATDAAVTGFARNWKIPCTPCTYTASEWAHTHTREGKMGYDAKIWNRNARKMENGIGRRTST